MIDAASFSHSPRNGSDVHVMFVDWIPFIFSSIGMLVINSIEKSRLQADSFSYSGSGVAWKARFVLFLGFSMLAGGLAGSVVWFLSFLSSFLTNTLINCTIWSVGVPSRLVFLSCFLPQCLLSCIVFCSPHLSPESDLVDRIVWMQPFDSLLSILLIAAASYMDVVPSGSHTVDVLALIVVTDITVWVYRKYLHTVGVDHTVVAE